MFKQHISYLEKKRLKKKLHCPSWFEEEHRSQNQFELTQSQ